MSTVGSFWVPPPPNLPGDSERMISFAKFIVMILVALMILPMAKWCCKRRHAWLWAKVAGAALIIGIAAFFTYQVLLSSWTVKHGDKVLYIGRVLTQNAAEYKEKNPLLTKEDLLFDAGWNPKRIWTEGSLLFCRLVLSGVYILCTPLFAIAIMAAAHSMYCAKQGGT
jgi:hypothetical protein